ncbi:hypothetical protein [Nocardia stercoris]|uniref:hypothetical protein n=1 Tax=Nocardia stercoris TaxID=2483361 RepID=UPI0011C3838D|nr:hypothetical protein [Nocardia stercoris]
MTHHARIIRLMNRTVHERSKFHLSAAEGAHAPDSLPGSTRHISPGNPVRHRTCGLLGRSNLTVP